MKVETLVIEAIQNTGTNFDELKAFLVDDFEIYSFEPEMVFEINEDQISWHNYGNITIKIRGESFFLFKGNYLIKTCNNEIAVIDELEFQHYFRIVE